MANKIAHISLVVKSGHMKSAVAMVTWKSGRKNMAEWEKLIAGRLAALYLEDDGVWR